MDYDPLYREFWQFIKALGSYLTLRLHHWGLTFEKFKNLVVDILMVRRGANTSLFVHLSILGLAVSVLVAGGVIVPSTVVSGSYPGVPVNPLVAGASTDADAQGAISSSITPVTIISDKPRDKIIDYEVKSGDTVSSISQSHAVSEETIMWANELSKNSQIVEGDKIDILPVSGVVHKVQSGDTIYSVAKKYRANAQAIIDFPFNDIGDNFALASGEVLIVPDGAPPEKAKPAPTQYLATGLANIAIENLGSAQFIWPAVGDFAQYFSWYHPALDISNLSGGPIRASDSGTIKVAGWPDASGYGNRVIVDHGNGYETLYAHLSATYVTPGQKVSKGEVVGAMGSTGRSSGTHLHFEIIKSGTRLNPYSILGR